MNDATLNGFRQIADAMGCGQDKTWAIVTEQTTTSGEKKAFVKAFGYTRKGAEGAAIFYQGGRAVREQAVLAGHAVHCYCASLADGSCDFCTGTRRPQ